jgi:tripartite ATP-independent transporter DctM subunit
MAILPILMFLVTIAILLTGYPVAFALSGSAILFAVFGYLLGYFDWVFFSAIPLRMYGIMTNQTLIAVPLFIFMGVMLEKSKISEELLEYTGELLQNVRGGLAIAVCLVGALLAASTGIVGATVVTMGLISLPTMLKSGYRKDFSCGVISASGTLGQIIPPSIVLIILGDVMSSANQQAQLKLGNFSPKAISVGDLFWGALFPGLLLVSFYIIYIIGLAIFKPSAVSSKQEKKPSKVSLLKLINILFAPILLIVCVLGSILFGFSTPTEAAGVGGIGSIVLTFIKKKLSWKIVKEVCRSTAKINCMIFAIIIGSSFFSLVFRGFQGDEVISAILSALPGGAVSVFLLVMLIIFFLGFFLDFFEITFVVVPLMAPVLIQFGFDPIWIGIMIAMNLQTSFLTPPFGFALFYLKGVLPKGVSTINIYKGVIPFIVIQLLALLALWFFPDLVTWLPNKIYS